MLLGTYGDNGKVNPISARQDVGYGNPFLLVSVLNISYTFHFAGMARVLTSNLFQLFRFILPPITYRASYFRVTLIPFSGITTSQMSTCPMPSFSTSPGMQVQVNLFSLWKASRHVGVYECTVEVGVGWKWVQHLFSGISRLDYSSFCYVRCCLYTLKLRIRIRIIALLFCGFS